MTEHAVPQPALERLVPFRGRPVLAGVVPDQNPLVVRTAVSLAHAVGAPMLHLAYVDPDRYPVTEHADGSVRHEATDPDADDDGWLGVQSALLSELERVVSGDVPWQLTYLAGRPDRALTHLARAVDAAVIVVGTRSPGPRARLKELVDGSVAAHLCHHQHRPVLTVPLSVVDWKDDASPWEP